MTTAHRTPVESSMKARWTMPTSEILSAPCAENGIGPVSQIRTKSTMRMLQSGIYYCSCTFLCVRVVIGGYALNVCMVKTRLKIGMGINSIPSYAKATKN